jgi:predicted nucleic-acid-binding Zn-ribbon protein
LLPIILSGLKFVNFNPMYRWVVVFCLLGSFVRAQTVIEVNDSINERVFMPYELSYFVDPANRIPFATISQPEFASHFQQHSSFHNSDFETNASYWIRLPIQPNLTTQKVWLLEFYDQTIDSLEAFVPQANGTYKVIRMGDHQRFQERSFRHKNFEILLNMNGQAVQSYYFKVRSHEFADVRVALRSVDRFVGYALSEYYLYGMFYGMILIISVYNFLVFLAIREIKFIYYICYILSVALYAMSYDGIGFQFFWPNHPELNDWAVGISLYLLIFWSLVFTRRFLSTRANAPKLDKALRIMIVLRTVWFGVSLLVYPKILTFRSLEIVPLSLIFFTAISVWRSGYRPARFFVIAYGVLFSGFFLRTLVYYNLLPITTATHYSLHFSFVFEMLFLTVALGDRIRILKDNRDRAMRRIIQQHEVNMQLKDKVNRELESKVMERTLELGLKNEELEQSNAKLHRQSVEINQINSILDLDNWKLKNRVKEVLEERMHEKRMDFKEFATLYPDDLTCYRFLEELKSQHDFECAKCGNKKHSPGAQKFARRCTRCGYNESVTANTVFHRVKFPIAKAFYLTYLAHSGKSAFTLESLSKELDLRLNTIWAFKQKVLDRIAAAERSKTPLSSWEDLIIDSKLGRSKASKNIKIIPQNHILN